VIPLYDHGVSLRIDSPENRSFKAAVLMSINESLEVKDLKFPSVEANQVLVKIIYSGICRSQIMEIQGKRGEDKWLPHTLGHEAVGVIQQIHPTVEGFDLGEKVILSWVSNEEKPAPGLTYESLIGEKINSGPIATFGQFALIHKSRLYKVLGNFDDKVLTLFGCSLLTGAGMVFDNLNLEDHKRVLVLGFGGIGSAAAVTLSLYKGIEIVILDTSRHRIEMAKKMGFEKVVLADSILDNDLISKIGTFDLCIESAGSTQSIELGFSLINRKGTLVFASHPSYGEFIKLDPFELIKGKTIIGSWGGGINPQHLIEKLFQHFTHSNELLMQLVGKIFLLDQINDAVRYLEESLEGRALIEMKP
jgi:S-(hydroxymethyl)glutathione dehydrogenase/alcohol dehydrogenase